MEEPLIVIYFKMLSTIEAEFFLVNILGFKNWKDVLKRDKLEFFRMLVPHYVHHLAFQNISMSCIPPGERHVPKEKEIIAAGLSGIGGVCITKNTFLTILLQTLGFNAYVVSGFVYGPGFYPDNHVACVVEFSPDEKYFLDLGIPLPFKDPIPMHQLPYTQIAGGFRYTYKKADDDCEKYIRVQLDGALYEGEYMDKNTEHVRYEFTMQPQNIEFFQKPLKTIFQDADKSIFLQYPVMSRYFEEDDAGNLLNEVNINGDRKWIVIRGVSVLIGTDKTRKVTNYLTYDEVKDVIFKYFPQFRKEDVEKSIQYFNESVPKYGYFKAVKSKA